MLSITDILLEYLEFFTTELGFDQSIFHFLNYYTLNGVQTYYHYICHFIPHQSTLPVNLCSVIEYRSNLSYKNMFFIDKRYLSSVQFTFDKDFEVYPTSNHLIFQKFKKVLSAIEFRTSEKKPFFKVSSTHSCFSQAVINTNQIPQNRTMSKMQLKSEIDKEQYFFNHSQTKIPNLNKKSFYFISYSAIKRGQPLLNNSLPIQLFENSVVMCKGDVQQPDTLPQQYGEFLNNTSCLFHIVHYWCDVILETNRMNKDYLSNIEKFSSFILNQCITDHFIPFYIRYILAIHLLQELRPHIKKFIKIAKPLTNEQTSDKSFFSKPFFKYCYNIFVFMFEKSNSLPIIYEKFYSVCGIIQGYLSGLDSTKYIEVSSMFDAMSLLADYQLEYSSNQSSLNVKNWLDTKIIFPFIFPSSYHNLFNPDEPVNPYQYVQFFVESGILKEQPSTCNIEGESLRLSPCFLEPHLKFYYLQKTFNLFQKFYADKFDSFWVDELLKVLESCSTLTLYCLHSMIYELLNNPNKEFGAAIYVFHFLPYALKIDSKVEPIDSKWEFFLGNWVIGKMNRMVEQLNKSDHQKNLLEQFNTIVSFYE